MNRARRRLAAPAIIGVLVALGAFPGAAAADGPSTPVASSYVARLGRLPAGMDGEVVDGDQQMWLRVPASATVVVLDYRGAPYLRFSGSGVEVNHASAMYYLNQTPVARTPPPDLRRSTPPDWRGLTRAHEYIWRDGRLHALATVAIAPDATYAGRWSIPVLIDGRLDSISGALLHARAPSIAWFWPIAVLLSCVIASLRVHRSSLDLRVARSLATGALLSIAVVGVGQELHGRPTVPFSQLIALGIILAFVGWGLFRVRFRPFGFVAFFVIGFAALYEGAQLIPLLSHGFVLVAEPAFVARAATVLCLACGSGLLLLSFRLAQRPAASSTMAPTRRYLAPR